MENKYTDQQDYCNIDDNDFILSINNFFSIKQWFKIFYRWIKKIIYWKKPEPNHTDKKAKLTNKT